MPTPLEMREQYFNIAVEYEIDDKIKKVCRTDHTSVKLNKYFLMNWTSGSSQETRYSAVVAGGTNKDAWFKLNKDKIQCAAMGKGAPEYYGLALQWAVHAKHIKDPSLLTIQQYFDDNMGLDCSGFATNYLIANGKLVDTVHIRQNTSAASYFIPGKAVNDVTDIRQGDLLVQMSGNTAKTSPGHVMVVESLSPVCSAEFPYGSMRVIESTGADAANPKLSDSVYKIDKITAKGKGGAPCMILEVTRLGKPNFHVSVNRVS